jgi:hypothetical protein
MDFNATIDLIIKDLKETSDIIDDLKKYPGVPHLQVELAKSKCKSAGEVIALLKTLKENSSFAEKEPLIQKKVQKQPPVEDEKPLPVRVSITTVSAEKHEESPVPEEEKREEFAILELEPLAEITEPEPEEALKIGYESAILADRFSHLSGTFNEQLGTMKGDDDIADILKTKPLTSLLEAIGVNDRFLFIREIFNGNQNAYNQAISRLESAENLTDARAVVMSYTGDNSESEAVKQLLDLVKRKLPSHE